MNIYKSSIHIHVFNIFQIRNFRKISVDSIELKMLNLDISLFKRKLHAFVMLC